MIWFFLLSIIWTIHCGNHRVIAYYCQLKVPYNEAHLQTQLLYDYFGNGFERSDVAMFTQESTSLTFDIKNGIKSVFTKDILLHIDCIFQDFTKNVYPLTWRRLNISSMNISYGEVEQRINQSEIDYIKAGTTRRQDTSLQTNLNYFMLYCNQNHLQLGSDQFHLLIKMTKAPVQGWYPSQYHELIYLVNLILSQCIGYFTLDINKKQNSQILGFSILLVAGALILLPLTYELHQFEQWNTIIKCMIYGCILIRVIPLFLMRNTIGLLHIVCLAIFAGEFSMRSLLIYTAVHLYSLPQIHADLLLQNKSKMLQLCKIALIGVTLTQIHFLKGLAEQTPTDACPYVFQNFYLSKRPVSQEMLLLIYFNAVLSLDLVVKGIFKANSLLAKWFDQKFAFAKMHLQGKEKDLSTIKKMKNV